MKKTTQERIISIVIDTAVMGIMMLLFGVFFSMGAPTPEAAAIMTKIGWAVAVFVVMIIRIGTEINQKISENNQMHEDFLESLVEAIEEADDENIS